MRTVTLSLSRKEHTVLELLIRKGELYGLKLVEESGGELGLGTIYVTLARMETQKGYIASFLEDVLPSRRGPVRRLYRATELGRRVYEVCELARRIKNSGRSQR